MYNDQNPYGSEYGTTRELYREATVTNTGHEKKKKKNNGFGKKVLTALTCGIVGGLAAAAMFVCVLKISGMDQVVTSIASGGSATESSVDTSEIEIPTTETTTTEATNVSTSSSSTVTEIAKNVMPSIVSITVTSIEEFSSYFGQTTAYESTSCGTGIIVGQNDTELLIVTNNHVVSGASELTICFNDNEEMIAAAKIKGTDANNDLAVVAVQLSDLSNDILSSISIATLGDSDSLEVGEQVIAIGNALGYGQSVTTGVVSALDREVTIDGITSNLIQTDAAINPGNSGGALINMNGEVIGINSSKYASTGVEGMGYAIPISTAIPILENLMNRETREVVDESEQGYLGISCQNVTSDIASTYGMPEGVYILDVTDGYAAADAGLQKGDIITAFDGLTISDYDDLKETLTYYASGETVVITIQRSGTSGEYEELEIEVTLSANTSSSSSSKSSSSSDSDSTMTPGSGFGGRGGSSSGGTNQSGGLFDFFN